MKKVSVECWLVRNYRVGKKEPDWLFITYPEHNGHELITCLSCGYIYAVSLSMEPYFGPRSSKLSGQLCVNCGGPLHENTARYPETYVLNGIQYHHFRDRFAEPDDEDSIVVEFMGIYP